MLISSSFLVKAQDECGHTTFTANEAKYSIGKFYECLSGLRPCIAQNAFNYEDKVQVYQLMGMCYMAVDSIGEADKYIEKLLTMNDNYQPDGHTPQRYRSEVDEIRSRMRATLISSVSKKNESIDLAPATVQIINAEEILRRGYKDVEEIFSDLPGFDISRTRGVVYSVLYQRGYRTGASTDRTLILVDGVEDNDMWSNSVYLSKQFPISNIKRIEVIYGPSSTIYGANAYAGVINIVTKGEEDFFGRENNRKVTATAQVGGGSFNTQYGNATVAVRTNKTFFSVTGGMYHSDEQDLSTYANWDGKYNYADSDYKKALTMTYSAKADSILNTIDPDHKYHQTSGKSIIPTAAAISQAEALDKANYRKTFRGVDPGMFSNPKNDLYVSAKLNISGFKFQFEYFDRNEGLTPDYNQKYYALNTALQNWQVRQGFISARYDKKLTERFQISSFSYFRISDRGKNAVLTPYTSYLNGGFSGKGAQLDSLIKGSNPYFTPTYKSTQSNQFRTELRALYNFTDKIDFSGGLELRNGLVQGDYVNSSLQDPLANGYMHDSASYYNVLDLGIFALATYKNPLKRINVDLGGRMDNNVINNDYGYGHVFNPRVSFVYYPSKYIFKAIYSEAFLDASPFNKFSTTASRIANPTLTPEKVKNVELTAKYNIRKKTSVEVAYYHSWYSNSLITANVDYNGTKTTQFQASGKAEIQGIQLAAETSVSIFSIYANATFTDPYSIIAGVSGKDSARARMGDIATYSANAGVNMRFYKDHFNLNMRVNVVGDKETGKGTTTSGNPYSSTPGYFLLNGTLGYKITKVGVVQFRVDNILNTLYYSPGIRSASGIQTSRVPLPGRVYYAQFNLNLN
ncbi:MAG: hypothetical protein JWQ38_1503 [Flavipsychrobacter sp.]|nr:hypothetical protein [Flavipsychrobacter sp.]